MAPYEGAALNEAEPLIETYFPLNRNEFMGGAAIATLFVIQNTALSILLLIGMILTLGLNVTIKDRFFDSLEKGSGYLLAIPIGLLGILFPHFVNQRILEIPDGGLVYS